MLPSTGLRVWNGPRHAESPATSPPQLSGYGQANMTLALRGLETKTTDPYLAVWRKRVVPTVGNLPMTMICNGTVDRAVHGWIAHDCTGQP